MTNTCQGKERRGKARPTFVRKSFRNPFQLARRDRKGGQGRSRGKKWVLVNTWHFSGIIHWRKNSIPTTNVGMQTGSSVGIYTHCNFCTFGADLYAQSVLISKISAWRSVGSLLRVRCWLGCEIVWLQWKKRCKKEGGGWGLSKTIRGSQTNENLIPLKTCVFFHKGRKNSVWSVSLFFLCCTNWERLEEKKGKTTCAKFKCIIPQGRLFHLLVWGAATRPTHST